MTRIFAPGPRRNIPDATAAVQQLERLLTEAGELRDRIASACTGTAAYATVGPDASTYPGAQRPLRACTHPIELGRHNGGTATAARTPTASRCDRKRKTGQALDTRTV